MAEDLEKHDTTTNFLKLPYAEPVPEKLVKKLAQWQLKAARARKDDNFNQMLIQTGLGIMAGKSRYAMQNIGEGGMAGLKNYQEQILFYQKLKNSPVQILLPVRTEEWGQKHFMVQDPGGMTLDIVEAVEPASEYKDKYTE